MLTKASLARKPTEVHVRVGEDRRSDGLVWQVKGPKHRVGEFTMVAWDGKPVSFKLSSSNDELAPSEDHTALERAASKSDNPPSDISNEGKTSGESTRLNLPI